MIALNAGSMGWRHIAGSSAASPVFGTGTVSTEAVTSWISSALTNLFLSAFLDFGGRATTDTIYKALEVISKLSSVKAILVNLFGGIVRTDLVAQAILDAYKDGMISVPIYARISGAESEKSRQMLSNSNAKLYDTVEEAISSLVHYIGLSK